MIGKVPWIAGAACTVALGGTGFREWTRIASSASVLPADGVASATLSSRLPLSLSFSEGAGLVRPSCSGSTCVLVAGLTRGRVAGVARTALASRPFSLELRADDADHDGDGFPDLVRLTTEEDKLAFRRWFAAIAEAQAYRIDPEWPAVHHDCAGLLRFAYKEALKAHGRAWRARRGFLPDATSPDVRKYEYPNVPVLGERLFRVAPGPFDPEKVDGEFSASATAKWLMAENAVRIPAERAERGDLLFFEDPDAPGMGFHSMVLLGDAVVYHTGPDAHGPGTVKRVLLAELSSHPDEQWRPRADNPHFLGFYRWKIAR